MHSKRLIALAAITVIVISLSQNVLAGDLKLTLPKRSQLTPVQRLNREGVDAVRKQQYEKAEGLFYKAYLFDPADPFTLYNLGYVSELKGDLERAHKFYGLASEQSTGAVIDRTSSRQLEGKPLTAAFGSLKDGPMQVNRLNVEAIRLLSEDRAPEAEGLVQTALAIDPKNAFTLNNMGVVEEARGNSEDALKYYQAAADSRSSDPVIVTLDPAWRGKPVSQMAADSERRLRESMQSAVTSQARAAVLTARGVSETNRNDWEDARRDFLKAYSLDPNNAFSLNNIGFVAELDGDLETAQFFYGRARKAEGADVRVGFASRRAAEGKDLLLVAGDSNQKVGGEIVAENQARRRQPGPIQLKHRDNTPVVESPTAPSPAASPVAQPPVSQPHQ